MTPRIKSQRSCSKCGSKTTYTVKSNQSPHWYHSKTTGDLICKRCYNNKYVNLKRYLKRCQETESKLRDDLVRIVSYTETGDAGTFKKRRIVWDL